MSSVINNMKRQEARQRRIFRPQLPEIPELSNSRDTEVLRDWWANVRRTLGEQADTLDTELSDNSLTES